MTNLELSIISNNPNEDFRLTQKLLEKFEAQHKVHVQLSSMPWERAWQELFTVTMQGKGPDVSQIGSTWTRSLEEMNALRPFTRPEVEALGGAQAFIPGAWQSAILPEQDSTAAAWSIPWFSYAYVFAYRRDMLARAGLDEQTAFSSAQHIHETLQCLQSSGLVEMPLALTCELPFTDLLHTVSSWVWGAGGDLISRDGRTILFNRAEALAGLKDFFSLYNYLPPNQRPHTLGQTLELFEQGRAAVTIADPQAIRQLIRHPAFAGDPDNLGTAPLSGRPWLGGSNLIIWRHTQGYPERERAALALVSYLAGQPAQLRQTYLTGFLPVRQDVLPELALEPENFRHTLQRVVATGQPYPAVALWRRIEFQLGEALVQVLAQMLEAPAQIEAILHNQLDPLARRLELTLNR